MSDRPGQGRADDRFRPNFSRTCRASAPDFSTNADGKPWRNNGQTFTAPPLASRKIGDGFLRDADRLSKLRRRPVLLKAP